MRRLKRRLDPQTLALACLFLLNLGAVNFISRYALTRYPGTGDEHAILFQAKIFSHLELTAPAPPLPQFFQTDYLATRGGKWFSVYPPVYSLMLAPGVWLGEVPFFISLISSAILILLFLLIKDIYRDAALAWTATLLLAISPTFLLHSASYYNHLGALLALLLCLHVLRRAQAARRYALFGPLGLLVGLGAGIRPFTFLCLALPMAAFAAACAFKHAKTPWRYLGLGIAGVLAFFFLLALQNRLIAGSFSAVPYFQTIGQDKTMAWSNFDAPNLRRVAGMLNDTLRWLFAVGMFDGNNLKTASSTAPHLGLLLAAAGFIFVIGRLLRRESPAPAYDLLFLGLFLCLVVGHVFHDYPVVGGRYGERFFFEATFIPVLFLAQAVTAGFRKIRDNEELMLAAAGLGAVLLAIQWANLETTVSYFRRDNRLRMGPFLAAQEQGISNGIIFVHDVPDFAPSFYARNNPDLSGDLFVPDRGPENKLLAARFPAKKPYVFSFSPACGQFQISALKL